MTNITKGNRTHGEAYGKNRTNEYKSWAKMIGRCTNKKDTNYFKYGGRGITICSRWLNSYENFLADMGRRPAKHYSLDRINNDGNYEPGNCRWATPFEQANNTRRSLRIKYNNEEKSIHEWCDFLGLDYKRISRRIWNGWDSERALSTPILATIKEQNRLGKEYAKTKRDQSN